MKRLTVAGVALAALLGAAPSANAAIIFDFAPPFPSNPDQNLLFNDPGLILTGTTVQGSLTSPAAIIDLTGLETLVAGGGQARVKSNDNGFTSLLIQADNPAIGFTAFEANPQVFKSGRGGAVSGTIKVTVTDMNGGIFSDSFTATSSGNNFLNVLATDQYIRSILIESTVDLSLVEQIRLGGVVELHDREGASVPEPATLLLLGIGLSGAAVGLRKRSK
jgi:hypothetical protein